MAVVGDGDAPFEVTTRHRRDGAQIRNARHPRVDGRRPNDPVDKLWTLGERCLHPRFIEIEPAWARGFHAIRIDSDHFEKKSWTEVEQRVVGSHRDGLAARLRPHAQLLLDPLATLFQCQGGNDEMIGLYRNRTHPRGLISSAEKSSSTRAPLGSKKNTCHVRDSFWRRHTCSTLCATSMASVSARPCAVNAM